jgi:hypothetical protein
LISPTIVFSCDEWIYVVQEEVICVGVLLGTAVSVGGITLVSEGVMRGSSVWVWVGVNVRVGGGDVRDGVEVRTGIYLRVAVRVGVLEGVQVGQDLHVGVLVGVSVGVSVAVDVSVGVAVLVVVLVGEPVEWA